MPTLMCTVCQYTLETDTPPEKCPACGNACPFVDATCYTPECGLDGPGGKVNPTIFESHRDKK